MVMHSVNNHGVPQIHSDPSSCLLMECPRGGSTDRCGPSPRSLGPVPNPRALRVEDDEAASLGVSESAAIGVLEVGVLVPLGVQGLDAE